jgi:hypothetical protein
MALTGGGEFGTAYGMISMGIGVKELGMTSFTGTRSSEPLTLEEPTRSQLTTARLVVS